MYYYFSHALRSNSLVIPKKSTHKYILNVYICLYLYCHIPTPRCHYIVPFFHFFAISIGIPLTMSENRAKHRSDQIRSVDKWCPTPCDPMNCSTSGLPVHHQLLEFTQTHVHRVSDAIQPSHPLSSPSPPAPSASQHHSLFQ